MPLKQDLTKGITEGAGRVVTETAQELGKKAIDKGTEELWKRLFGKGPGDEARFVSAWDKLNEPEKETIVLFLSKLKSEELEWFIQVVALMTDGEGTEFLKTLCLANNKDKRKICQAVGAIKPPALGKRVGSRLKKKITDKVEAINQDIEKSEAPARAKAFRENAQKWAEKQKEERERRKQK